MHALRFLAVTTALAAGCNPVSEDDARAAVEAAFEAANPPGRTGLELGGRSVWVRAPMFEDSCLEQKDLAFNDDPATRPRSAQDVKRISPTYQNQRYITARTRAGWCVYLGEDPTLTLGDAKFSGKKWEVVASYGMKEPSPWFECLSQPTLHRVVEVAVVDGAPEVVTPMAIAEGSCPHPLPGGEERVAAGRPATKAPAAPTKGEVQDLMRRFDNAIYEHELEDALSMVSCYNLFEEQKYGTCSVGELVSLGPLPRGGASRPEDGVPWLENVVDSVDAIRAIKRDSRDPSLYHVSLDARRGGSRTMAVQWVRGGWKLVGVVGAKAEDLTTMRFVYDLDRRDKREIFERRMQGEPIDEKGYPLDPYADMTD